MQFTGSSACCTTDPAGDPSRGLQPCAKCYAGSVPCDAYAICPPVAPAAGCAKSSCPFSFSPNASVCGEVDAAPRMPDNIWNNPAAVDAYVAATIKYYNVGSVMLQNAGCNRTGKTPDGSQSASWTSPEIMQYYCADECGCTYPACPDNPTGPGVYCSLCGPKFNQPINVTMWRDEPRAAEVAAATTVDANGPPPARAAALLSSST